MSDATGAPIDTSHVYGVEGHVTMMNCSSIHNEISQQTEVDWLKIHEQSRQTELYIYHAAPGKPGDIHKKVWLY